MARLSILGLYTWDPSLFDLMKMPSYDDEGETITLDREALKNLILMNYGELEVLFPNADSMKQFLSIWSESRLLTWSRMFRVLAKDYDPFINIKRDEVREITQDRNLSGSYKGKINAWNDANPVDRDSSNTTDTGQIKTTEHYHIEGDSAITDAQDVLRKEMQVRATYNMYDIIAEEFKQRFCVMVY